MNESSDRLRQHGVHVTAQRLAVLQTVVRTPHATADEITKAVRVEIGVISRQAVYDALAVLAEVGLIRRIQPAGSPARYEDRTGDNHHHLICRTCGGMTDVGCAAGAAPCLIPLDDLGFEIEEAEVIFWGRCPSCLAEAPSRSAIGRAPNPVQPAPLRSDDHDNNPPANHRRPDQRKGEPTCQKKPASAR